MTMDRDINNFKFTQVKLLSDEIINSIGHDLRTPLTSIKGFAQLLRDAKNQDLKTEYYCNLIDKNSNRLHDAIENIIEILNYNEKTIKGESS